jgi:glycosyltransferase involved in cell wall biosynthesis
LGVDHRITFEGHVPRREVFSRLSAAAVVVFTGLREEGGIALAEALLLGVPVAVLGHGGARTVAQSAVDSERVALIPSGSVDGTARRLGEALQRLARLGPHGAGPMIDQEQARHRLWGAVRQALAAETSVRSKPRD